MTVSLRKRKVYSHIFYMWLYLNKKTDKRFMSFDLAQLTVIVVASVLRTFFKEDINMKKQLTEMVFILDKSGSMAGLETDTIGGFNSMIERQKEESSEALVTTVLFSDKSHIVHDRVDIAALEPMNKDIYRVGGSTALIDAIGGTIKHIVNIHRYIREEDRPEKTVFIIITDGQENTSHRYSSAEVKAMIEKEKTKYGWEFIFLAANIDAVETAAGFGIDSDRAVNYHSDTDGTRASYESVSEAISELRQGGLFDTRWRQKVDSDFKARSNPK